MSTRMSSNQEPTENVASGSDNNNNNNFNSAVREHMFDKVLTPSDVGKLNRLVIPKQHAENYFPLENNQTGTMLDFEDRTGKTWRFRYSFWNSSQSYVMTKGWSRFVKEKKLDRGDTVSFHRGRVPDDTEPEKQRNILFIDWSHSDHPMYPTASYYPVTRYGRLPPFYQEREFLGYGYGGPLDHYHHHHQWSLGRSGPLVYDSYPVYPTMRLTSSTSSAMLPPSLPSQPPPTPEGTVRKVRLFGVDVEESSSSGETRDEMSVAGYSMSAPVVVRDDESSNWRWPRGEMGAASSSSMRLSDDEEYQRKGKSLEL